MRRSLSWPQLADPFPSLDMEEEVASEEQQDGHGGAASGYTAYSYSKDHTKVFVVHVSSSRRSALQGPTVHSFDGGGLFVSQRHGVFYSVDTEEEERGLPASVHRHILTSSRIRHLGTVHCGPRGSNSRYYLYEHLFCVFWASNYRPTTGHNLVGSDLDFWLNSTPF